MASLPLDPVYSRVLLSSFDEGCPADIIDLVSLLGSRDTLLINTVVSRDAANAARKKFVHRSGDHWMLLNVFRAFEDVEIEDRKQWCKDNFISIRAMNQVLDARKQLVERCTRLGLDCEPSAGDEVEPVLNSLIAGLFANTALLQADGTYRHTVTRQVRAIEMPFASDAADSSTQAVAIHPGSILHNKKSPAIVYDELVRQRLLPWIARLALERNTDHVPLAGHDVQDVRSRGLVYSAELDSFQGALRLL